MARTDFAPAFSLGSSGSRSSSLPRCHFIRPFVVTGGGCERLPLHEERCRGPALGAVDGQARAAQRIEQNLARRMIAGEAFREVSAVIGGGGFWYVDNTEDQYMAAASLNASFDHMPNHCFAIWAIAEGAMRVAAENLAGVLFDLYLAHDRNARSPKLWDEIAQIQIISADEAEVIAALVELHDRIESERRQRH